MLTIKVPLREAEALKKHLLAEDLLLPGYNVEKDQESLYFPIKERFESPYDFVEREVEAHQREQVAPLREALQGKLPDEILDRLKTAYDTVGDIAILEIDDDLREYETLIGQTLLDGNPKLATVVAKDASHEGTFRTQQMRLLAGIDKRTTLHKENGVTLEVDVEGVYFSSRLSTERKRIMQQVRPGERILVMFAGCGPYTCVLAKNTQAAAVVGIEINPRGHALAEANIKRNKLAARASTHCGDVRAIVPGLGQFDRILMPLPKSAETFLDVALGASHPGTIVHFYAFLHEDQVNQAHTWIAEACAAAGVGHTLLATVRCGQQAPHVYRFCIDFSRS